MKTSKQSVWLELRNNSFNVLKFFFEKSNIVNALYKYLRESEQVAVLKTLSGQTNKLYANNQDKIVGGVLRELKLIYAEPDKIQLNEVFRTQMNRLFVHGREMLFPKVRTDLQLKLGIDYLGRG